MLGTGLRGHKARDEASQDEITDDGVREETACEARAVEESMEIGPDKMREERRDAGRTDEDANEGGVVLVVGMHTWRIQSWTGATFTTQEQFRQGKFT